MRIAVTGAGGLFGYALVQVLGERHTVIPLSRTDMDITSAEQVEACFRDLGPEAVIHAAAIRDLDICEANPAEAFRVNFHGTRNVVEAARRAGAAMAYISTDAVFDGEGKRPYVETDVAVPPTVYGRTKLGGERLTAELPRHWIFRISVLFGPGKLNLVDKVLTAAAKGETYVAPSDQTGTVTYTLDAARTTLQVMESSGSGLFHVSSQGAVTRLEFAKRAAEIAGLDASGIVGKPSSEMGRRAARPKYGVMAMKALEDGGFTLPRPWDVALEEYVGSLKTRARASIEAGSVQS
jgi:dTDP-4-dehydrorhamnose reductase